MPIYDLENKNGRVVSVVKSTSHHRAALKAGKHAFKTMKKNQNKSSPMEVHVRKHGQSKAHVYKVVAKRTANNGEAYTRSGMLFKPRYAAEAKLKQRVKF